MFRTVGTKERLVDRVVEEIQRQILDGKLAPGTKLPPERELCEQLGVSRTALREAVRMLVSKGLLETMPGVGTLVREMKGDQIQESISIMLNQDKNMTMLHLHAVRRVLEVEIARLAALHATPEDIARLRKITHDMENSLGDPQVFSLLDAEYHRALAESTKNPLLATLMDSIRGIFLNILVKIQVYEHQVNMTLPDHHRIIAAVAAGDADAAAQAMRLHLEHALFIMQERWTKPGGSQG